MRRFNEDAGGPNNTICIKKIGSIGFSSVQAQAKACGYKNSTLNTEKWRVGRALHNHLKRLGVGVWGSLLQV
jgi:hypothetical protein